jgi:hypothetical protein
MAVKIRYTPHPGAAVAVIGPMVDQAAYRAAQKLRGRILSNIRAAGRVDTGKMMAGMQVRVISNKGLGAAYQVYSSAPYTRFQEFGTRAHGPRVAKFMVFTPKGSGSKVFAKWVRGVTPGYFVTKAVAQAQASDFVP